MGARIDGAAARGPLGQVEPLPHTSPPEFLCPALSGIPEFSDVAETELGQTEVEGGQSSPLPPVETEEQKRRNQKL